MTFLYLPYRSIIAMDKSNLEIAHAQMLMFVQVQTHRFR